MRPLCLKLTKSELWHLRMHHLLYISNLLSELMVRVKQQVGRNWSWAWGFRRRRLVESPHWRRGRRSIRSKKRCKVCSSPLVFPFSSHLLPSVWGKWTWNLVRLSWTYLDDCAQTRLYMFRGSSPHYLKVIRPKGLSLCCASQCNIPWSCQRYSSFAKLHWSAIRSPSYSRRG